MIRQWTLALLSMILSFAAQGSDFKHYLSGNSTPISVTPEKAFVLMGGGVNQDAAFVELIRLSHGGNIVVLRTTDDSFHSEHIFSLGKMNSAETLVIPSAEAANDPFVVERLSHASAVFIAGGDQFTYYKNWKKTQVSKLLNEHAKKGTPIAGTSAGLAVLGEFAFIAEFDTVESVDCLKDPFDQRVTLARNFLELTELKGWITDTHFHIRDRMGRLLTFMSRIQKDHSQKVIRGVAVDEDTTVVVSNDLKAHVIGEGAAYFLKSTQFHSKVEPGQPLNYRVEVYKLTPAKGVYDFAKNKVIEFVDHYFLSADHGQLFSTKKNNEVY